MAWNRGLVETTVSIDAFDFVESRWELRDGARSEGKNDEREFPMTGSTSSISSSFSEVVNKADNISDGGGFGSIIGAIGDDGGVGVFGVDEVSNFPASGVGGGVGGGVDGVAMVGVNIDTDGDTTAAATGEG